MNIAVILASGQGKRMGAPVNKVLLRLRNKPIIFYTLSAFQRSKDIHRIIITGREEDLPVFDRIRKKYGFDKVKDLIQGGTERQDSAHNAVTYISEHMPGKDTVVLFHNGANPFVTPEEIAASAKTARRYGACAVAHPTKDTIKEVTSKGVVARTLDRSKLRNMQTPQAIRLSLAKHAFDSAKKDNFIGTDDVSLVERLGRKVKIIEGSLYNFKITTPLDLAVAKIVLNNHNPLNYT